MLNTVILFQKNWLIEYKSKGRLGALGSGKEIMYWQEMC